jgi:endonuclease III
MKNTNQYIQKLKKIFSILKKGDEKPKKPVYHDPIEAIVFAVLCEKSTESCAKAALKKIQSHFVDFNDLRVARAEEIAEVISPDIEEPEKCAAKLTLLLNAIFQKYDCLVTEDLTSTGKRGTKEILEKFNGMTNFISSYIMLIVCNAHAVPLTEKMIQYLKAYNVIDPKLENEQIVAFVEKQISAANAYTFYTLVRHDSELVNPKATLLLSEKKPKADRKPKAKK